MLDDLRTALEHLGALHRQEVAAARLDVAALPNAKGFSWHLGLLKGSLPFVLEEPVTVAVRVCHCGQYLGTKLWSGKDAHPGQPVMETHGICEGCYDEDAMKHDTGGALQP